MHRFDEAAEFRLSKIMKKRGLITSIRCWRQRKGDIPFIEELAEESLESTVISLSTSHGHANSVIDMIQRIKNIA